MERYNAGKYMTPIELTEEMNDWFEQRTYTHKSLVKKYCNILANKLESKTLEPTDFLRIIGSRHDNSKLKNPERDPYVLVSWNYKQKRDGNPLTLTDEMNEWMNTATVHHVKTNPHHPEYWSDRTDVIPKKDRDKFNPNDVPTIEIKGMSFFYLCEMVADWCAMSEELGTNTPREWADKMLGKRWKFSEDQTKQIYQLIDLAWE